MIFSESRFPLFGIMLWRAGIGSFAVSLSALPWTSQICLDESPICRLARYALAFLAAALIICRGNITEAFMARAYWVATYFSVSNPQALAEYAKLAGPAIAASGGRFLARGTAVKAYEKGLKQRVVLIEFDSVEKAEAAHDSPGYQAALRVLGHACERDLRIVEGVA
jgi:uncharacterized protein (DUF1330 family)